MDFLSSNDIIDDANINIVIKKRSDILDDLKFKFEDERLLCDSIIADIEKTAAHHILHGKIAQLPLIGNMRKSPVREVINKNKSNFKIARSHMTKQQYKEYVGDIVVDFKKEQEKKDNDKKRLRKLKSRYKKDYDNYVKQLGIEYANMFIYSRTLFKEIPFDVEVQEMFDKLKE